jgi:hypothetical protein
MHNFSNIPYDIFEIIMLQNKYLPDVIKMSCVNKTFQKYSDIFLKYNNESLDFYSINSNKIYNKNESKIKDLQIFKKKINLIISINPKYIINKQNEYASIPFDKKFIMTDIKIENLQLFKNIPYLDLWGCKYLYNLSKLENIKILILGHCKTLKIFPILKSLEKLSISSCFDLKCLTNLQYSSNLNSLKLEYCNISDISILKKNKNLNDLYLNTCINLKSIGILTQINKITIIFCPKI